MSAPLWQLLESRRHLVAVMAEWRSRMQDCFPAIKPLLQPTDRWATSYPASYPHQLPWRVVRYRNGSMAAIDTEDSSNKIQLNAADLVFYELDRRKLRQVLCQTLGLVCSKAEITHDLMILGNWEPKPAAAFPVIMVCGQSARDVNDAIRLYIADAKTPAILLTPTRDLWGADLPDRCREARCLLISLNDIITHNGTTLVAGDSWPSHQAAWMGQLHLPENFQNKRPKRKRTERAVKIEAIRRELLEHIRASHRHANDLYESGQSAELLPRPSKSELALRAGVQSYDITRCFNDDPQIRKLWEIAANLDDVLNFGS